MQATPGNIVPDAIFIQCSWLRCAEIYKMEDQTKDREERNDYGYHPNKHDDCQGHSGKVGQQNVYNNDIQLGQDINHRLRKDSRLKFKDIRRPEKRARDAIKATISNATGFSGSTHDSIHQHYEKQRSLDPRKGYLWRRPLTNVDTLPYPAEGVEVVYTNDPADAESWLKNNVIDAEADALGMDIEWRPQFLAKKNGGKENKTAVLQLAVEASALVLHLFHMNSLPKSLADVLGNQNVLKVGSGIKGDVIKLIKDTGMLCDGGVDTQDYAKALGMTQGNGLKKLSKKVLDVDLNKPRRVSLSNWEAFPLRKDQITYAALDAWIGLKLYFKMKEQLAKQNESHLEPQVIDIGVDEPEIEKTDRELRKNRTCQGCNETLPTKGKLYRHKFRCVLFNTMRNKGSSTRNSNNQLNPDQTGCQLEEGLLGKTFNSGVSSSGHSGTPGVSGESSDTTLIVCPVSECRVKCQGQDGFAEHIKASRHACCAKCGKIFRSKVSRHHRKLHYSQDNNSSQIPN